MIDASPLAKALAQLEKSLRYAASEPIRSPSADIANCATSPAIPMTA